MSRFCFFDISSVPLRPPEVSVYPGALVKSHNVMLVKESGGPPGPAASLRRMNIFVEPVALSRCRCERDELSEIAVGER